MLSNNPFLNLAEVVSPYAMQSFIIAMVVLIAAGTIIQMIHHKNVTYFLNNAKKAKLSVTFPFTKLLNVLCFVPNGQLGRSQVVERRIEFSTCCSFSPL